MRRLRSVLYVLVVLLAALAALAPGASAFSAPETVLSGLAQPAETATTKTGDLYFTQLVAPDTVTLSLLAPGSSTPVEVYRLVGSRPYLNDIHFDPAGDPIFITSVATDPSSRRWALTRLDPSTGIATELVVTTGSPSPTVPPFFCVGSGCGLLAGTEIDLAGVDGDGTIFFAEHSTDPLTGNQVADLLALDPGSSTPREVAHFAGPSGFDLINALTAAKTGEAYFSENASLYQVSAAGLRVLVAGAPQTLIALHSGLDAAGDLYVLEYGRNGFVRFGCATSTTMRVVRFSARDLGGSSPTPVTLSETTYDGFIATWAGSSSFFRVSQGGDVYWAQSPIDCASSAATANDVIGVTRAATGQALLYDESAPPPPASDSGAAAQGPLGIATRGGAVDIASIKTGELVQVRR
jgi:hypothetical protein